MDRLPHALLLSLSDRYLLDREVASLAAVSHAGLNLLQSYRVKRSLYADECGGFVQPTNLTTPSTTTRNGTNESPRSQHDTITRTDSYFSLVRSSSHSSDSDCSQFRLGGNGFGGGGGESPLRSLRRPPSMRALTRTPSIGGSPNDIIEPDSPFRLGRGYAETEYEPNRSIYRFGVVANVILRIPRTNSLPTIQHVLARIPPTTRTLYLESDFDLPVGLVSSFLPPSLRILSLLRCRHIESLQTLQLPTTLVQFVLPSEWNQPITELPKLPDTLRTLNFGIGFNHPISNFDWPPELTFVEFGPPKSDSAFNQPLIGNLPDSITALKLPSNYPHAWSGWKLPASLTKLTVNKRNPWDPPIDNVIWPPGLRTLKLPPCSTQPLTNLGQLPPTLTRLAICNVDNFDHPIMWDREDEPKGLTELKFKGYFVLPLTEFRMPSHFKKLIVPHSADDVEHALADLYLPPSLEQLRINSGCQLSDTLAELSDRWPANLTWLDLRNDFHQPVPDDMVWPPALTRLTLGGDFDHPLTEGVLPSTLLRLELGVDSMWTLPVDQLCLPAHLEVLEIGSTPRHPVRGLIFPESMKVIKLSFSGRDYSLTTSHGWNKPTKLKELHLLGWWNLWVDQLELPQTLEILQLSNEFNRPVDDWILPSTLRELRFGDSWQSQFNQPLDRLQLPSGLRVLSVPGDRWSQPSDALPPTPPVGLRCLHLYSHKIASNIWAHWPLPIHCTVQIEEKANTNNDHSIPDA